MVDPSEQVVLADPDVIAGLDYWRTLPIKQQPEWPDPDAVGAASAKIATLPPLVFAGEVDILRERLARAARGDAFLLQGGDCAETFAGATADQIRARVKTMLQMAVVLTYGASKPVVKMGRMAGQFAKPRSNDIETRGDVTLPAYRGDIVNGYDFTPESRQPDAAPARRGVPHLGRHAESRARLHPGWVRRPAAGAQLEPRLRAEPGEPPLRAGRERDRSRHQVHGGGRCRLRRAEARRVLHEPRGPAHGLRAPDDAHRLAHRHAVQHVAPTSCGSASAPATSTARTSTTSRGCATRSA